MWKEFKNFAFKGNVLDMAVGVIIGGAFSKIVASLVNDIIMPIFGVLTAGVDFKDLKWVINEESAILYGSFVQNIVDFLIVAVSIFIFIRLINKLRFKQKEEEVKVDEPKKPTTEELLTEIVALLKTQQK